MTKEEARLTLQDNFGYLSQEHPRILEALRVAIDALSQPSLPSDLDEAAKDYCNGQPGWENKMDWVEEKDKEECRRDFKAGAGWMAQQGASFKVNVEEVPKGHWYAGLHLGGCAEEEENALKSINAKDGEEVIVQIRKKQ